MPLTLAIDPPADLARLQSLLDRQDAGQPLSAAERAEAEGLVDLADLLALLRLRAERGDGTLRLPSAMPSHPTDGAVSYVW